VNADARREYILKQAAWLLRLVAEGGQTSAAEFWTTTLALEAVLDDDDLQMDIYHRELSRYEERRQS
jgi:hypothetical protein